MSQITTSTSHNNTSQSTLHYFELAKRFMQSREKLSLVMIKLKTERIELLLSGETGGGVKEVLRQQNKKMIRFTDGDFLSLSCLYWFSVRWPRAWWMWSSHLILAGTFLARNQTPALSDLRNITNGFIPEILAGQLWALIGQFEPSMASDWSRDWGWRLLTGHRSSFTPILDTPESAFRFTNLVCHYPL